VLVDAHDPALLAPNKPIGSFMSSEQAHTCPSFANTP
jgi:carbamate kinase